MKSFTLIIPPKERERQCFLLKGVRESDVGVNKGCFSNCTQTKSARVSWAVSRLSVCFTADLCYLSDQFLFLGRLWHAGDLLVQFLEGRVSVILSINRAAAGDAILPSDSLYGGRGGGRWDRCQGSSFLPRAENQIILLKGAQTSQ